MQAVLDRFRRAWAGFTFNQKAILAIVLGAGLLSTVIFTRWLRTDDMTVLFTNLEPTDAAEALDEATKQGVEARLEDGGRTLVVPSKDAARLKVQLAKSGIPDRGGPGNELFDQNRYGMTEFLENVNLRRALEGELARTIAAIQGVDHARVHLTLPKDSPFVRERRTATASVLLTIKGRARPGREQVDGIQRLVASAVEGLDPAQVTVVDQSGAVLSLDESDEGLGLSSRQLRLRKEVEDYLAGKASDLLGAVVGPAHSIVRVNADLDFDRIERTTEQFDPQTVIRSEERTDESGPEAGAASEHSITNYEVSKRVETVLNTGGGIRKLSVAVTVDGKYTPPAGGGGGEPTYQQRSTEELDQISRIVAKAVGVDPARGDMIEVVNMRFDLQPPEAHGPMDNPLLQTLPSIVGRVLLFLVAAVMILGLRRNLGKIVRAASAPTGARPAGVAGASARAAAANAAPAVEVEDWARANPDDVANLIKSFATTEE